MSKTFRAWKIDEPLFLPPTVQDFVAEDHLARFVLSLVRDDLDLIEISGTYGSERGQPPFDPTMMTALLLYSYCCGASPYRLRKQLPEPVFGQIKQARGFRQFLLRGFANVRAEWAIVCTVHNLLKLALAKLAQRWSLSAALPPALAAP